MSAMITFFPVGDGGMMSRIRSSVTGVRRLSLETSSSVATPIDHATLAAHDRPKPSGEIGREAAGQYR